MVPVIKYSILMPYYNRHIQLVETLQSFQQYKRDDFEVILIEDDKNVQNAVYHQLLLKIIHQFNTIKITHLRHLEASISPVTMFNMAAKVAKGQYLILTSPECRHEVDILSGLDIEFDNNIKSYVICACQSLNKNDSFHMWYQHSIHRNAKYHFCSAISRSSYFLIGGFDEQYKDGYCFDDDDFRDTIKKEGIPFVERDDLFVSHQAHDKGYRPINWEVLWNKNKKIYESKFGIYVEQ